MPIGSSLGTADDMVDLALPGIVPAAQVPLAFFETEPADLPR
jgi:hypothetical protein